MTPSPEERATGALVGTRVGDALAMPVHWYYDRAALRSDYGLVDTYRDPRPEHPNSILWRSSYEPTEPEYDILGDERRFWGRRGVHYHQHLRAGENTLTVQLLARALEQVVARGSWDRSEYIDLYLRFMRDPAGHRDTYVEECHRGFFENLRRGQRPERCAVAEKHIGGLAPVVPLYARLRTLGSGHEAAAADVVSHVAVTHAGPLVREAVENLLVVTREVHEGGVLGDVLGDHARRQDLRFFRGPVMKLLERADDEVVGRVWSPACYLDDSLPATLYLALKYAERPREALVANTMVGGDNCHRGAVLGGLLGLAGGPGAFDSAWRTGLRETLSERSSGSIASA